MKKEQILKALLAAVLAGLGVFILSGCTKSFNLNDYFSYSVEGYNGYGRVSGSFDYLSFENDLIKKTGAKAGSYETSEAIDLIESNFSGEWDTSSNLSNGDSIRYIWNVDLEYIKSRYNLNLKWEDVEVQVSGLEDAPTFDAFTDLVCTPEGVAPNGTLRFENKSYPNLYYYTDNNGALSNGDVIDVYVDGTEDPEYFIDEHGALPAQASKQYTVTGLAEYVISVSGISPDLDAAMKKALSGFVDDYKADHDRIRVTEYNVEGYYLLTPPDLASAYTHNVLYLVYSIKLHNLDNNEDVTAYRYLQWQDVTTTGFLTGEDNIDNYNYPSSGWFYGTSFTSKKGESYTGYASLNDLYVDCTRDMDYNWNVDTDIKA